MSKKNEAVLPEVINKDGQFLVTSLNVAEVFKKLHKHVIEKIESLDCSSKFTESNFRLSEYKDKSGKENKMYYLTKDGLSFLVMGYTGKKAAQFKEAYILEFNRMAEKLNNKAPGPETLSDEDILKRAILISTKKVEKLQAAVVEKDKEIRELSPLAAFGAAVMQVQTIPLSLYGSLLSTYIPEIGKKKIYFFLRSLTKPMLYLNKSGNHEVYAKYVKKDSQSQYFIYTLSSYDVPIKNIKTGEVIDSKKVTKLKINVNNLGAVKILDLLFENRFINSQKEYMTIYNAIPKWFENYKEKKVG